MPTHPVSLPQRRSPFDAGDEEHYQLWRAWKLRDYPASVGDLVVDVADPRAPTPTEAAALLRVCRKTNMVVYRSALAGVADKAIPRLLGAHFGLQRLDSNILADEDGITSLQVVAGKSARGYIPYSNRRLLWHSDGYYNPAERSVRAFVLHCVSPAADGGENELLDHEMAYLHLRDADAECARALMAPDAMTIPANTESGEEVRGAVTGPVFSVDAASGTLHMRYTARTRSIEWKQDAATRRAVGLLEELLSAGSPYLFRHRLAAGEGLLSNNVLHNRTGFTDDVDRGGARLIYRARYFDRIRGTELNDIFDPRID
jgi:alpha-ketoglutarate-dependent taurine dioxygenase